MTTFLRICRTIRYSALYPYAVACLPGVTLLALATATV